MAQHIAIGIDIGGTSVKSGIVRAGNGSPEVQSLRTAVVGGTQFSQLHHVVLSLISEAIATTTSSDQLVLGISTSGTVDCGEVVADAHFYVGYNGTSWRDIVNAAQPGKFTSIRTLNDGNAAAWAEFSRRDQRSTKDAIHVSVGTGVAGGIVIDGHLVQGVQCAAGEIGHIIVVSEGRRCPCGRYGCVEAYAGTSGIIQNAIESHIEKRSGRSQYKPDATFKDLLTNASNGDEAAVRGLEIAGMYLGVALASLVNILNPGLITLGGGVVEGASKAFSDADQNPLMQSLLKSVESTAQEYNLIGLNIQPAKYGNQASWIGAALYAMGGDTR